MGIDRKVNISVSECASYAIKKNELGKYGTKMHLYFDNYFKKSKIPSNLDSKDKKIFDMFLEFLDDIKDYILIESEKSISYNYGKHKINGCIDAIFGKENDKTEIIIVDWKIMKEISEERYLKYTYVMNMYTKMLCHEYPIIKNIRKWIVMLHNSHISYVIVPVKDCSLSLDEMIKNSLE